MFDSINERLATLITTQKTLNSLQHTIAEKEEKPQNITILPKIQFLVVLLCKGGRFFALQSVHPDTSFELSSNLLQRFLFFRI